MRLEKNLLVVLCCISLTRSEARTWTLKAFEQPSMVNLKQAAGRASWKSEGYGEAMLAVRGGSNPISAFVEGKTGLVIAWSNLMFAILVEIWATTLIKVSTDRSSTPLYLLSLLLYNTSLTFFSYSLSVIPVSTAYAIWSALGTAAVSIAGVVWFGEVMNMKKGLCLVAIVFGVVGLNLE
mmetsp:Transcript_6564/g.11892  ORF Transcript_6564/g.11892 Transcript_6564/m.11892 type:complete len:180 (+) Transcript_6564:76-615(+)